MDENFANGRDIPLGFGMALAQNVKAMEKFASLSEQEKKQLIDKTHSINSKQEMKQFVDSI